MRKDQRSSFRTTCSRSRPLRAVPHRPWSDGGGSRRIRGEGGAEIKDHDLAEKLGQNPEIRCFLDSREVTQIAQPMFVSIVQAVTVTAD